MARARRLGGVRGYVPDQRVSAERSRDVGHRLPPGGAGSGAAEDRGDRPRAHGRAEGERSALSHAQRRVARRHVPDRRRRSLRLHQRALGRDRRHPRGGGGRRWMAARGRSGRPRCRRRAVDGGGAREAGGRAGVPHADPARRRAMGARPQQADPLRGRPRDRPCRDHRGHHRAPARRGAEGGPEARARGARHGGESSRRARRACSHDRGAGAGDAVLGPLSRGRAAPARRCAEPPRGLQPGGRRHHDRTCRRLLRDGGPPSRAGDRGGHPARSAVGGVSRPRRAPRPACLLVRADLLGTRPGPGNVRELLPRGTGAERRRDRADRDGRAARRHRDRAQAGRSRGGRGARRGAGGRPPEIAVPRQHEPRDPHPDERHHRDDGHRPGHEARQRAARVSGDGEALRRLAAFPPERHTRFLEGRGRAARSRARRLQPPGFARRHPPNARAASPSEAARARVRRRGQRAGRAARRPRPPAAGGGEPRRQRHQVHRRR